MSKIPNALLMAGLFAGLPGADLFAGRPGEKTRRPVEARKCALPGCENRTTHNGGYCCAEHCREHRRRHKK